MILILLVLALAIPDPVLTPGAIRPLSVQTICATVWRTDHRHVSLAMKRTVARRYHIPWSDHTAYQVDHLIPRSLGGADVIENLWMQPLAEAHGKDVDEARLARAVCHGTIDLHDAQERMRHWGS